jgi:glucan 1,4-alpha-glucosidase
MKLFWLGCFSLFTMAMQAQDVIMASPNKNIVLHTTLKNGLVTYDVNFKNKPFVLPSSLQVNLKDVLPVNTKYSITNIDSSATDETWEQPWGENKYVRNNYKKLTFKVATEGAKPIIYHIIFKVFNEGVAFRYEWPMQPNLQHFIVSGEASQINLNHNYLAFWLPGDFDSNEYPITACNLSDINPTKVGANNEIHARTLAGPNTVQTPLMLKGENGIYVNLHEAALVNYPAMNLKLDPKTYAFTSVLVPDAVGNFAYLSTPSVTPWRTINIADKATDILASRMILNLNEPSKIKDPSFIKPTKYVGVWWEMHVGKSTWDYAGTQDANNLEKPSGKHGATTANTKRYIDFASTHGFDGVLVEGWNVGWEDWFGKWKENVFDFVTPYPDFNVTELKNYAAAKNVKLIMHHETSGSVTNYERWMDTAYRFMKANNYPAVKTGYVGRIIPRGEHHDGQWMVNHFVRAAQKTADYKLMLCAHEPVRPTGLHRTYPNWLASEAARGTEFNAWSEGNKPSHETILPFTRLMGGPMDYTPGIFKMKLNYADARKKEQMQSTLAKQLALYVTIYSPLQMAADLPENYEEKLDAFQFIKDVAVDWDTTVYLSAEPGQFVNIARKTKNKNEWFVGAITNENKRLTTLPLAFLGADTYEATIYMDAPNADIINNMEMYQIKKVLVNSNTILSIPLATGGGCAISIKPATGKVKKGVLKF